MFVGEGGILFSRPSVFPSIFPSALTNWVYVTDLVQKEFWWQKGFVWLTTQTHFSASTEGLWEARKIK